MTSTQDVGPDGLRRRTRRAAVVGAG